jgi:ornithine carbamoyltransferase
MAKHLVTLREWTPREISEVVDLGIKVKKNPKKYASALRGKMLAMLFQKTSTRTRVSFEVGMEQLGGHAVVLDWTKTQFGIADIRDETRALCRYCDVIMARLLRNADLRAMASASSVPVINGCDEKFHPCQALADAMTIKESFGKTKGVRVAYLGIANNVSNSLSLALTGLGMEFTLCSPERHPPSLDRDLLKSVKSTGRYNETKDVEKAVKSADVIYTDTWMDMELMEDPKLRKEMERRAGLLGPYQVNSGLLRLNPKARIMHDMPMHVGHEITREAIESPRSLIFEQAENRLHVQKALLLRLLRKA